MGPTRVHLEELVRFIIPEVLHKVTDDAAGCQAGCGRVLLQSGQHCRQQRGLSSLNLYGMDGQTDGWGAQVHQGTRYWRRGWSIISREIPSNEGWPEGMTVLGRGPGSCRKHRTVMTVQHTWACCSLSWLHPAPPYLWPRQGLAADECPHAGYSCCADGGSCPPRMPLQVGDQHFSDYRVHVAVKVAARSGRAGEDALAPWRCRCQGTPNPHLSTRAGERDTQRQTENK